MYGPPSRGTGGDHGTRTNPASPHATLSRLHRRTPARRLTLGATNRAASSGGTQGVTKDSIKVGIALIDFTAIKDFVDYTFGDTQKVAQVFVDYINNNGGIDGRKIDPGVQEVPADPGGHARPAVAVHRLGRGRQGLRGARRVHRLHGQGQLCLTKEHKVIHIGHELDQPWIDAAPGGLLLTPDATKQGVSEELVNLLSSTGRLKGKTVAVLGDKNNARASTTSSCPR